MIQTYGANLENLKANPGLLAELERLELTTRAARFVEDSTVKCPVCRAIWPEGHLKTHLEARIATAQAAEVVRKEILESAEALAMPARTLRANVDALKDTIKAAAERDTRDQDLQVIDSWLKSLNDLLTALAKPVEQYLDSGFSTTRCRSSVCSGNLNRLA